MPTIILNEIACLNPMGVRDDVFLSLSSEEGSGRILWGPYRMREGDEVNLRDEVDPIEYEEFAIIALYEHDEIGDNDYLGERVLGRHETARSGGWGFPGDLNSRYILRYEIQVESHPSESVHCIKPVSLHCHDAQGRRDEVTLSINNRIVLGPRRTMKEDWTVNFSEDLRICFRNNCVIRLQDTQGQDWDRSFSITPDDFPIPPDVDQSHTFDVRGSGVIGDARYYFTYQLLA